MNQNHQEMQQIRQLGSSSTQGSQRLIKFVWNSIYALTSNFTSSLLFSISNRLQLHKSSFNIFHHIQTYFWYLLSNSAYYTFVLPMKDLWLQSYCKRSSYKSSDISKNKTEVVSMLWLINLSCISLATGLSSIIPKHIFYLTASQYYRINKQQKMMRKYYADFGYGKIYTFAKIMEKRNPGGLLLFILTILKNEIAISTFDTAQILLPNWNDKVKIACNLCISTLATYLLMYLTIPLTCLRQCRASTHHFQFYDKPYTTSMSYLEIIDKWRKGKKIMLKFDRQYKFDYRPKIRQPFCLCLGLALYEYLKGRNKKVGILQGS